jgi:hypothetical protein
MTNESNDSKNLNALPNELRAPVTVLTTTIVAKYGAPAPAVRAWEVIETMKDFIVTTWPLAGEERMYDLIAREAINAVRIEISPPVHIAPKFVPWFADAVLDGEFSLERWYSYKEFLSQTQGFAPQVIASLDQASSEVVDLLGDPRQSGSWKRRGLVIGDVQSGKTATYIGIINKAADAGYKIVMLLTGGTESLRKQTQYRVDEGFLGKDSAVISNNVVGVEYDRVIGVGNFPTGRQFLRGQGMTTYKTDFNGPTLIGQAVQVDPNADHPYIFVIKKNKTPLTNLITWLSGNFEGEHFDVPMLVVDDESDYASVNTNYKLTGDTSPTVINQKIRELLALTTRSSYMAFTATPFANVFIDHTTDDEVLKDDLFPHDYIVALSSPSNYLGSQKYFPTGDSNEATGVVDINDAHEVFPAKHKSHLAVDELPESLGDALNAFIVASAIRIARGDKGPRSMLVNVSRFKNVQAQVFELISIEFARIKAAIEIHANPPVSGADHHQVIRQLANAFDSYYSDAEISWETVRDKLFAAVYDTSVELVNSTRDKSDYEGTVNRIAVGGDVLSRGLTLEGLTVSYFYRLVGAADTLMQMARWFGYRPGYDDLTRVWISRDIADQFRYVSEVTDELREQIREMRNLGKTPADFGLMVRKHPESLAITAKRGVAEKRSILISLAGRSIETPKIPSAERILQSNDKAVREFLKDLESVDTLSGWEQPGLKFKGKKDVGRGKIADLLENFLFDRRNLLFANALYKIVRENKSSVFQNWTVGIVGGSGDPLQLTPGLTIDNSPVRAVRYSDEGSGGSFTISGNSARVAGSTDLARTYAHVGVDLTEPKVLEELPSPTLLIYPIQPNFEVAKNKKNNLTTHQAKEIVETAQREWAKAQAVGLENIMALKVSIPGVPGAQIGEVEYFLNGPAIDNFRKDFEVSADDEEDLDD